MKIALLSGAYKNSGDFLIERRSLELLKYVIPEVSIQRVLRNRIDDELGMINSCDAVVFGGGPIYQKDLKNYLSLKTCTEQIVKTMSILGGGWYGVGSGNNQIYDYIFEKETEEFLQRIDAAGGVLSVRDLITYQVLKNNGFKNVYMTGCPAWYDLAYVNQHDFRGQNVIRKIVISDPARTFDYDGCVNLINYISDRFSDAEIVFAFHRGITESAEVIKKVLTDRNIKSVDLSGNSDGFKIYDECDLHIGYRVHAHIYNLSIRNRSVLIEEDGRGAGVNESLGLPSIKAYNDAVHTSSTFGYKVYKRTSFFPNRHLIQQVDSYLETLQATDYQYIKNAFLMQGKYFESMVAVLKKIGETA